MRRTNRVELPPGCAGLDVGGRTLRPREQGGAVEVPDHLADPRMIRAFGAAPPSAGFSHTSIPGAVCGSCGFHRFAWNDRPDICPRCGAGTPLEIAS